MKLAIPSQVPGGLDAELSPHFGHCPAFTLLEVSPQGVEEVGVLPNEGHTAGGCMAPVMMLKEAGVEALVAGGMGARPLAGFQQVGIQVYFNEGAPTVREAAGLVAAGQARMFGPAQVCQSHSEGQCGQH
ncbi:MAG: NifB/NifX family molybdenum-iron cluster-binding protein [Pseudomonadota bacterium]